MRMKYGCWQNLYTGAQGNMVHVPADYTRSSSALPTIRTVYASVERALQSSHLKEISYDREKGGLEDYIYILLETQTITSREYISLEKTVFNIGLMPLLLENTHATALLSRVMNLVKEAVEHLLTKRYSGCGPTHLVTTNNYMIMMGGGGGGSSC